ncbi:hypothetical protein COM38_26925 [Bacillus toyonensis]|uniref:DUF6895 family protein n=1 Tax=Bacillus toyonensis TaxID=155322 RepID=UPI000BED83C0|nr:hypothetical protein [Bacillus toyonensis]PEC07534.1 hypothetical protein CON55_28635 [Bacillus toyonensis]PGD49326.1 hypothetical protein COM38_26925 [Bacillus toyonensis]
MEPIQKHAKKITSSEINTAIHSCAERGLTWMSENLSYFLPEDLGDPDNLKEISELALMYGLVYDWADPLLLSKLKPIGEFLSDYLENPLVLQYALKLPAHSNIYFSAYLSMRAVGCKLKQYEDAINRMRCRGFPQVLEMTPYRKMEDQYMCWRSGIGKEARPDWASTYCLTTLGKWSNPVYLTRPGVYSITHTLFYLTDFCGPCNNIPSTERKRVLQILESQLIHYYRKMDWDLTGELLINLVALDRSHTPLFINTLIALMEAWRPDGTLPSPRFVPSNSLDEVYVFRNCYHTTLVGILLCGAYLARNNNFERRNISANK